VSELLPDLVSIGVIQRTLQNFLREGVPILNLPLILEGIADYASLTKNPDDLSELVRRRLASFFVPLIEASPGLIRAITLDLRLEKELSGKVQRTSTDLGLALDPETSSGLLAALNAKIAQFTVSGTVPCLIVGAELRLPLRRFLEPTFPRLTVLSFQEIPGTFHLENAGIVQLPLASAKVAA